MEFWDIATVVAAILGSLFFFARRALRKPKAGAACCAETGPACARCRLSPASVGGAPAVSIASAASGEDLGTEAGSNSRLAPSHRDRRLL